MARSPDDTELYFPNAARLKLWLRKNHGRDRGAWILIAKKGTKPGLRYPEALDEALCWGWIDGKLHRHDERHYALWFSPRRPGSVWSVNNKRAVQRLTRERRMQPPGLARVREAKANGQWAAAYASRRPLPLRADVRAALEAPAAWAAWRATSPSRRLMLQTWIEDAKRPETRSRRLAELPTLVVEKRLPGFGAP